MGGPIHTDPNLPDEERDRIFLAKLKELSDEELANAISGYFCAPNPHYVNEAARRLRTYAEKTRRLTECLKEAADIACARCNVERGTNCDGVNVTFKSCLPHKWRMAI